MKGGICPIGHYCPRASKKPLDCKLGMYCAYPGQEVPTGNCTAGYFCNDTATVPDQFVCPMGHYCPRGTGVPIPCPAGTFSNATKNTKSTDCQQCKGWFGFVCRRHYFPMYVPSKMTIEPVPQNHSVILQLYKVQDSMTSRSFRFLIKFSYSHTMHRSPLRQTTLLIIFSIFRCFLKVVITAMEQEISHLPMSVKLDISVLVVKKDLGNIYVREVITAHVALSHLRDVGMGLIKTPLDKMAVLNVHPVTIATLHMVQL